MAHARPLLALATLALIAFWPLVLHPTETLYSNTSDLLAEHLPAKLFLVRSLRETGELPLWNPEQYAGSPFVHDIQVGLFYPPHLPLYFISEPAVGPFLSWLVFAHVLLAGCLMYAYARHAGMGELAAFTAGVGFMLAPRWMMQLFLAGHIVTQGIAWIPLVILCVEKAILKRSWRWAIGGGMAYALLILGTHPQWTFYGSILVGLWPLRLASRERKRPESSESAATLVADYGEPGHVSAGSDLQSQVLSPTLPVLTQPGSPLSAEEPLRKRTFLVRWLLAEATIVLIGLGLCAVQLLPTIEAAGESSRARGMGQSWSLDGAKAAALTLIGPIPDRVAEPIHWETRGGIGFTWAVLAIVGARLGGRRALVPALIAAGVLAYALGGSWFIDRLPGFDNFRMPTRMLLTLAFPIAFLAGLGVQSLDRERANTALRMASYLWLVVFANIVAIDYLAGRTIQFAEHSAEWWTYWLLIAAGWTWFLLFGMRWNPTKRMLTTVLLMIIDVVVIAIPYVDSRPMAEIYPRSPIIDYIRDHNRNGQRTYDYELHGSYHLSLLGPGSPIASVHGVPSVRGYNPLDVARYRQFLAFIADIGEKQTAFSGDFTHPVTTDFPLANGRLVDLLGVRYFVVSLPDGKFDGLFKRVAEDEAPRAYDFLIGMQNLSRQILYENGNALPRVFVVASVVPQQITEPNVLAQLKSIDVHHVALIEEWDSAMVPLPQSTSPLGIATIQSHSPNRTTIALDGHTAGLLVLTDPWYPGWKCWVDGQETKIWKADYAFRGVMVPDGSREVVFGFEPQSYRRGRVVSLITCTIVGLFFVIGGIRRLRK